jgi:hypothetical protein
VETAAPPRKCYSATARSMRRSLSDWTNPRSARNATRTDARLLPFVEASVSARSAWVAAPDGQRASAVGGPTRPLADDERARRRSSVRLDGPRRSERCTQPSQRGGVGEAAGGCRGLVYLSLYRQAARESEVPWPALAAIGSLATGVTSGPLWIPTADERPPSAGPTARLAQRHLAWLERRGGAANTLISSPESELCPAHPHTPAPDDEVRASSPTSVH